MGEKRFAASVNREAIHSCDALGITLEEFIQISLVAREGIFNPNPPPPATNQITFNIPGMGAQNFDMDNPPAQLNVNIAGSRRRIDLQFQIPQGLNFPANITYNVNPDMT